MDFGIAGKVAFVAGATRGMGRASAEILAREGARVAVVARGRDGVEETVEAIRRAGGEAIGIAADLTTRAGVQESILAVSGQLGQPEIVLGQTNDVTLGDFDDVADEDFERVFHILTMSQIYLARATVPAMRKRGWGRFIHIAAVVVKEPCFSLPHMLHNTVRPSAGAFLRSLAHEVASDGVTINIVAPGWMITPTFVNYWKNERGKSLDEACAWVLENDPIPAGRLGTSEEAAALVAFLASRQAAYITGELIAVDGGRHRYAF
jgi:NAD(P)-dependent dehydrogenase (short-subunit alcohol dehydrogenase family)